MIQYPSFKTSMHLSGNFKNKDYPDKWQLLETLYENFIASKSIQKIPKKIHQIWLGGSLPNNMQPLVDSVKKTNPDYEYFLWTDDTVKKLDFKNKNVFYSTPNLGQRSDILRYAILEMFGGIYLDTDFYCHKSFDNLLNVDVFAGVAYSKFPEIFNGLIGSTPNNILIQNLNNIQNVRWSSGMDVIDTTGPYFFTRNFFKNLDSDLDLLALPVTFFYPFPNFETDRINGNEPSNYIFSETICTHLWHSSWN